MAKELPNVKICLCDENTCVGHRINRRDWDKPSCRVACLAMAHRCLFHAVYHARDRTEYEHQLIDAAFFFSESLRTLTGHKTNGWIHFYQEDTLALWYMGLGRLTWLKEPKGMLYLTGFPEPLLPHIRAKCKTQIDITNSAFEWSNDDTLLNPWPKCSKAI